MLRVEPSLSETHFHIKGALLRIKFLNILRRDVSKSKGRDDGLSLLALLFRSRESLATDPRDNVYALLGMASKSDNEAIVVDYEKSSTQDVYAAAIWRCLRGVSLDMLSMCNSETTFWKPDWPTWVPDLGTAKLGFPVPLGGVGGVPSLVYRAFSGLNLFRRLEEFVEYIPNGHRLNYKGRLIGEVIECTELARNYEASKSGQLRLEEAVSVYVKAARKGCLDGTDHSTDHQSCPDRVYKPDHTQIGIALKEAMWRTFTGDWVEDPGGYLIGTKEPAPSVYARSATTLMEFLLGTTDPSSDTSGFSPHNPKDAFSPIVAQQEEGDEENEGVQGGLGAGAGQGDAEEEERKHDIFERIVVFPAGRSAFRTSNDYIGMGPRSMRAGDVVVVLFGGSVPFIFRPRDDHYLLVGDCYVHGIMFGELFEGKEHKEIREQLQWFHIH